MNKSYTRRLFSWRGELYDAAGSERLFQRAVQENTEFHFRHNAAYRRISMRFSMGSEPVPIPAAFLKEHPLWTPKPQKLPFRVTSSGTGGKKTNLGFCFSDAVRGARMTHAIVKYHKILSPRPAVCLMMSFAPRPNDPVMIAKTQTVTSFFAPPVRRVYALKAGGHGRPLINRDGLLRALRFAMALRLPVRIIGFPFYTYFFLLYLKKHGLRFALPGGSMVLLGGGWKGFHGDAPKREQLLELIQDRLGIPPDQYREFFGAAVHSSLYCACKNGHFHVPVYSRAAVLDVNTLKPLPYGKPGLLNLISPLAKGMPLTSILTGDLAVMHEGKECGCGISAPYFTLLGRAEAGTEKTCAADAAILLQGGLGYGTKP